MEDKQYSETMKILRIQFCEDQFFGGFQKSRGPRSIPVTNSVCMETVSSFLPAYSCRMRE